MDEVLINSLLLWSQMKALRTCFRASFLLLPFTHYRCRDPPPSHCLLIPPRVRVCLQCCVITPSASRQVTVSMYCMQRSFFSFLTVQAASFATRSNRVAGLTSDFDEQNRAPHPQSRRISHRTPGLSWLSGYWTPHSTTHSCNRSADRLHILRISHSSRRWDDPVLL
jgi:hypothetical protein